MSSLDTSEAVMTAYHHAAGRYQCRRWLSTLHPFVSII
jgi:hypothetical protein